MSIKDSPPTISLNGSSHHSLLSLAASESSGTSKPRDVFEFTVPAEAPVFMPTEAEFADPLAYIDKIRPTAEKFGICKIRPPINWQPPFAVDVDKLKFTPRIQRLNELEAKTRIKLNFLDQIAKFWELQGNSLKIPMVEKRALDLYTLHRLVENEGGFLCATKDRKWAKISVCMGYPHGKGLGTILKQHYDRLLFPYELFTKDMTDPRIDAKPKTEVKKEKEVEEVVDKDYKPIGKVKLNSADNSPIKAKKNGYTNTRRKSRSNGILSSKIADLSIMEEDQKEVKDSKALEDIKDIKLFKDLKVANPKVINNVKVNHVRVVKVSKDVKDIKSEVKDMKDEKDIKKEKENGVDILPEKANERKELKRLQFYGAGPKMAGYNLKKKNVEDKTRGKVIDFRFEYDPLAKYICHNCRRGDSEEQMLLCDGCDDSYHTFCLMPPIADVPKGDWCCPKCVATEVSKPMEAFGFEQAQREYNLQQFGEMADTFKSEYFNMPVHLVPTPMVEKEFWRIVSSIDEDVTVEYGADLHTMDHGSGFPTKNSINLLPGDTEYAISGWNLNNLPVLEGSVLGYINADISGMKVPWMYVGMCFATFCWHNEDHWSYSINYLHWGEPKTWYGVPGTKAELFEQTMKSAAPELFQTQPDLLHQLVTIMNPNILMNAGVPVFRTDQQAGEFVITFPRAYHAGFNQGYNFAEAVNFAPADWVAVGRECVLHYSQLRRFCVFSHDELICKMATHSEKLDITVAAATYTDMLRMVESEKKLRKALLDWGVTSAEREAFELLPDDARQCELCKTTCFMSALTCGCTKDILVCLRHYTSLCKCAPNKHTLRYRYTLDELLPLLRNLKQKAESFDRWADRVKDVLDRSNPKSVDLAELKSLSAEADGKNFPKSDLLQTLANAIEDAEKCASVIRQLDLNKIRTRHSYDNKSKLTVEELRLFCEEIDSLACVLDEEEIIKELLEKTNYFDEESERLLQLEIKDCDLRDFEQIIEFSDDLCIELPVIRALRDRCSQLKWLRDVYAARQRTHDIADSETLKELLRKGFSLPADTVIENVLTDVQRIITEAEDWEEHAQSLFKKTGPGIITEAELLIKQATQIEVYLPSENLLIDSVNHVNDWFKQLQEINSLEFYPYLTAIDDLVALSKQFPFQLEEVERLRSYILSANAWKDKTSKTFSRKNSPVSLMDALSPRSQMSSPVKLKKKPGDDALSLGEHMDPASVVAAFKDAEDREMRLIQSVRATNLSKSLQLNTESTFCICQKGAYGIMMQCDLCKDWFHSTCVQLPKLAATRLRKNIKPVAVRMGFKDCKFLCTNCLRTRRPKLETILGLLMSLQKLHSRLPEGEALQCLTERAMNWQDRARQLLLCSDMSTAVSKVVLMSQKFNDSSSAKIKNEMNLIESEEKSFNDMTTNHRVKIEADPDSNSTMADSDDEDCKDEHAYSINYSKLEDSDYHVQINSQLRGNIEDLVTEGDLLEVSLDENQQLWQLLFLSRDLNNECLILNFDRMQKLASRKGRKRRSDDAEGLNKLKKEAVNKKVPSKVPRKIKEVISPIKATRKRGKRGRAKANLSDDDAESDARCAVSTCLQPTGDEVDWVQCDGGCEQWFHMACVGLSVKDINEDEDYICSTCSPVVSVKQRLKMTCDTNDLVIQF